MENAGYLILSRQMMDFEHLDIIANNIAQTAAGSKQDFLITTKKMTTDKGDHLVFPKSTMTGPDWSAGSIKMTYRDWDLAITSHNGEQGFFMVNTPQGIRYTKNGSFRLDQNNRLVDINYNPVLSADGQEIVMEAEDSDPIILSNGTIIVKQEERGSIGVIGFTPQTVRLLNKTPEGYFKGEVEGIPIQDAQIIQGGLEEANGSHVANLALLISIQREAGMIARLQEDTHNMHRTAYRSLAQLSS